jgi:hypothetical protein
MTEPLFCPECGLDTHRGELLEIGESFECHHCAAIIRIGMFTPCVDSVIRG